MNINNMNNTTTVVPASPAVSVPLHWTAIDVPVGVMFAGRFGDEATDRSRRRSLSAYKKLRPVSTSPTIGSDLTASTSCHSHKSVLPSTSFVRMPPRSSVK